MVLASIMRPGDYLQLHFRSDSKTKYHRVTWRDKTLAYKYLAKLARGFNTLPPDEQLSLFSTLNQ